MNSNLDFLTGGDANPYRLKLSKALKSEDTSDFLEKMRL